MDSSLQVKLHNTWIERSMRWGEHVVADYAGGHLENSRAVSCFDAESNVDLQQKAKMCECAFAVWAGLDPAIAVHWARHCDPGSDVTWRAARWDVKATLMTGKYLVWPIAKNHIYHDKQFDCLVLVKHDKPYFFMAGWVTKGEFAARHEVSGEGHKLFPGTRYMHESDLANLGLLPSFYDGQRDFAGSLQEGYRAIRQRMANGGPGWQRWGELTAIVKLPGDVGQLREHWHVTLEPPYWYLRCRYCDLRHHLPWDMRLRTSAAIEILTQHSKSRTPASRIASTIAA